MPSSTPLAAAVAESAARLATAGIDNARREARLLLEQAGSITFEDQLAGRVERLSGPAAAAYRGLTKRRARGEPLSRIRGSREFWSLEFELSDATLDPRPDSECLIETALTRLEHAAVARPRILDLGTGSGCLLLALLSELAEATGIGVDRSVAAIATAARNAERLVLAHRARFVVADWTTPLDTKFDVVLANPPYIPTAEIDRLSPEVRLFDPVAALDGGEDGLDCYREIAACLPQVLASRGFAVVEIGLGKAAAVDKILRSAGLQCVAYARDLSQIKRCVVAVSGLAARPKKGLD